MLNRILLVCLLFAGSSLTCRWMDANFEGHTKGALARLETMKMNSTNSTDDAELPDAAAFPNKLYRHAYQAPRSERLSFAAHVLHEIVVLFGKDQTHASWSARTGEAFVYVIKQQADGVATCVVNHHQHEKSHRKMSLYFMRLAHVLEKMEHSADAWELIREQVKLHISKVHGVAKS